MGTAGKTALALCLLAAAVDGGLVRPPVVERAERDVAAWQRQAAATISCRVASREALGAPDGEAIALLRRHCPTR